MPSPRKRSASNPGDAGPTSRSFAFGWRRRTSPNASTSCGIRLLAFRWPKQPKVGRPSTCAASTAGAGHARVGDAPERAAEAGRPRAPLDVVGVDDQRRRRLEDLTDERELVGPRLPDRRDATLEHTVRDQAAEDAGVTFHRREVRGAVLAAQRETRHEMVEDEGV